jgi:thiol-disulfide isomerase/thioredoxin
MNKHKPYLVSHNSINFYKYLFSYITILSKVENRNTQLVDMIRLIDTSFNQGKADFLKTKFTNNDVEQRDLMNEIVMPTIKTKWCKSVIQSEIEKRNFNVQCINHILKALKNDSAYNYIGKPYSEIKPGAKLYILDSLSASDLLINLRMKFKGKALFIDFWATWCSGCIQDMPYSKKLHEEIQDLPIEFIYLCTSERTSLDKWISIVSKYGLSGTHIYLNDKIEEELMDKFFLNAFPAYAFIDKDGFYKQGVIRPSLTNKNKFIELMNSK